LKEINRRVIYEKIYLNEKEKFTDFMKFEQERRDKFLENYYLYLPTNFLPCQQNLLMNSVEAEIDQSLPLISDFVPLDSIDSFEQFK
jgi:hypothetical protein